jgi:hypothetical protein
MVAVAKALSDSAKTTKILAIRGGILDGNAIGEADVQNLATLPPLDVLRGQVVGAITAPLMTVVGLISAPVRDLLGLIDARIEQLKEQGDTSAAEAAPDGQTPEGSVPEEAADEASAEEPVAEATTDEDKPAEAEAAAEEEKED